MSYWKQNCFQYVSIILAYRYKLLSFISTTTCYFYSNDYSCLVSLLLVQTEYSYNTTSVFIFNSCKIEELICWGFPR